MGSVKIFLIKRENQDGTNPLSLRIIKNRKISYLFLGKTILASQWDPKNQRVKKSHPNSERLNKFLLKKVAEANDKLLDMEIEKKHITSQSVKNSLKSKNESGFFAQATLYLNNLELGGKFNRHSADQPRINRFKEFLKNEEISFPEITVPLLERFRAYLKGTRKISERTIVNHLIVVRTIFSQAMKAQLVDPKYYPFGKDKIRIKFPETIKIGLTSEEIARIEDLDLPQGSLVNHARNMWLVSFYFAGMRVSDLLRLKWCDFQDNRLHYAMGKNDKTGSLKVPEKALKIILQYEESKKNSNGLVFPDLNKLDDFKDKLLTQKKIKNAIKRLDVLLRKVATNAKISKKLTMHIARHSFGNISGDKISIQMLQKLYRHSSVTTTIGYQANFIHKDADDALDAVLSF